MGSAKAYRAVLLTGLAFLLGSSLPGHLSSDSITQLYEGRFGVRESFGPVVYSRVLGLFDSVVPGTGLYLTTSAMVLFVSLLSLVGLRGRVSWWGVAFAAIAAASPALLVTQGVVWKDVLFANLSVAGFVCLAHAAIAWDRGRRPWLALIGSALALALAMSVRQNGLVLVLFAALALGVTAGRNGLRSALIWGLGGFVGVVLLAAGLGALSQPRGAGPDTAVSVGVRILRQYDIVGVIAADPQAPLSAITAADPKVAAILRAEAPKVYSAERIDFISRSPTLGPALWLLSDQTIADQWLELVRQRPVAYLTHRANAFVQVFANPVLTHCAPVFVGIEGPTPLLEALQISPGNDLADTAMHNYATWWYVTPFYSHIASAAAALIVAGLLLLRRDPADVVMAGLMLGALGFAASFFLISLACDYRYLYPLDLAAVTGLLYLLLDPPVLRRSRPAA